MQKRKYADADLLDLIDKQGKSNSEAARILGVSPQAIIKRMKKLRQYGYPESFKKLPEKKQKFILGVLQEGKTQTQAAVDAYEVTSRDSAKAIGSQLMSQPDVQEAIDDLKASNSEIMQRVGITRPKVFGKLNTHIDNKDPNISLKAIEQTTKLAGWNAPDMVIVKNDFDFEAVNLEVEQISKQSQEIKERLESLKAIKVGTDEYEVKAD
jgi:hypothetical protein